MNKKIGIILLVFISIFLTVLVKNKMDNNFNFQYIGFLDEEYAEQYSTVQDYFYFHETGILVIKVYSDQISIDYNNDLVYITFLNETETIKTHIILLNKQETAFYNGIEVTKKYTL